MSRTAPIWSSSFAFFLVATGTAVGLGNLWRFPFLVGENGGSAFLIIYLIAVVSIGFPVMVAELALGRHTRASAEYAVKKITNGQGTSRVWESIGWLAVIIPFVGTGFYAVLGGWVLDYGFHFFANNGVLISDNTRPAATFHALLASPERLATGMSLFLAGVVAVVASGVREGLEKVAKIIMPLMFFLLLFLAGYAAFRWDISSALTFLFYPDFSALTLNIVLLAIGQAFFSLAIGFGAMITFGSYLPKSSNIFKVATSVCLADTIVAIIAGIMIFPIVYSFNLQTNGGEGLMFISLPLAFQSMPGGQLFGGVFFVFLFFAAFSTGIGTLEPVVAWAVGRSWPRPKSAIIAGSGAWFIGLLALFSFNKLSNVRPLSWINIFADRNIFSALDLLISNLLLPTSGLLIVLFAGWVIKTAVLKEELGEGKTFAVWRVLTRYIAPAAIVLMIWSLLRG